MTTLQTAPQSNQPAWQQRVIAEASELHKPRVAMTINKASAYKHTLEQWGRGAVGLHSPIVLMASKSRCKATSPLIALRQTITRFPDFVV